MAKDKDPQKPESQNDEENLSAEIEEKDDSVEVLQNGEEEAELISHKAGNTFLRRLMDRNFIEYSSYVIKERAIPDVDDGLKPVQRRILWSLHKMDDGKFHKVANVIGHTMQYHPHGDASIGDALVVLANKEYYIEKQGNFGNILTGDVASAARYIECRLSPLAREVLFNNDITEFIESYDGRNKEPIALPVKVPSLLMLGADGIAVGMATHIMPHNFKELLEAQIAILKKEEFTIYPDFLQGGIMDVSEYDDGNGKIVLRAKIDIDGRKLIIREIPATTTTEKLIASIERAANRNKIKITSINDYTTENVEIEISPMRGYNPEKALKALYAYTDCSESISVNLIVIKDNAPVQMSVSEVLKRNTEKLVEYLRRELEIEMGKLEDKFHEKTLEQIFIENRIYKQIEECKTFELVMKAVRKGLEKFKKMLKRAITDDDIKKLLDIPIRRISRFDIDKNKKDLDDILAAIDQTAKNLKRIKAFTIKYIQNLLKKYADSFPRNTEIETFDKIDKQAVALNNIKVGWDRGNCYVGRNVRSDDQVTCNEFDHLLCVERSGKYKIINIPDKIYVGRLFYFGRYDKNTEYGIIYKDKKTGKCYVKRCRVGGFITEKEYMFCPKGCRLEVITSRINSIYECVLEMKRGPEKKIELNLLEAPLRSPKARGFLIATKKIIKLSFVRLVNEEEQEEESPVDVEAEEIAEDKSSSGKTKSDEEGKTESPSSESKTGKKDDSKDAVKNKTKSQSKKDDTVSPDDSQDEGKTKKKKKSGSGKRSSSKKGSERKTDKKSSGKKSTKKKPPKKTKSKPKKKTSTSSKEEKAEKKPKSKSDRPKKKKDSSKKETSVTKAKTASVTKKSSKPTQPTPREQSDDDDDLGIMQPEFGF